MDLDYLHEFVVLAKVRQFQDAAEQLFISQPSLSKHIKAMEKEFGKELFDRSTRHVELTDFGAAFLPYAEEISRIQQEYTLKLFPKNRDGLGQMTIGIIPMITLNRVKAFPSHFTQKHPHCSVAVIEQNGHILRDMLRAGQIDMMVAGEGLMGSSNEFDHFEYTTDHLAALLREDHPLAHHEMITAEDLCTAPLLQLGKFNLTKLVSSDIPAPDMIASRISILLEWVDNGMGIGILTQCAAKDSLPPGVVCRPISPFTEIRLNVYYPKEPQAVSPIVYAFREYLQNCNYPKKDPFYRKKHLPSNDLPPKVDLA